MQDWNYQLDQFGRDPLSICLAIETSDIFNLDFLKKYRSLCNELGQKVPYVEEIKISQDIEANLPAPVFSRCEFLGINFRADFFDDRRARLKRPADVRASPAAAMV